jgi:hypothetical protein
LKCSLSNVDRRKSGRFPISSARSIFEVTLPNQFVVAKPFEKDSQRKKVSTCLIETTFDLCDKIRNLPTNTPETSP